MQPNLVSQSISPQKSGLNKKVIFGVIGVFFLLAATAIGLYLLGQNQDIRRQAAPAHCYSPFLDQCTFAQNPSHCWRAKTYNACRRLDGVVDNTLEVFSGPTAWDGQVCYTCDANSLDNGQVLCSSGFDVEINSNPVNNPNCGTVVNPPSCSWTSTQARVQRPDRPWRQSLNLTCGESFNVGSFHNDTGEFANDTRLRITGPGGLNVNRSNGQSITTSQPGTYTLLVTTNNQSGANCEDVATVICSDPPLIAQCNLVRVYDLEWNQITTEFLPSLTPGQTIRVTVAGSVSQGTIGQARFTINGETRQPVTQIRPGTNEIYDEFVIPQNITSFSIKGELFHPEIGWF